MFPIVRSLRLIAIVYLQELHLHGNSIGDEGVTALMSGLALHKGLHFALSISNFGQQTFSAIYLIWEFS